MQSSGGSGLSKGKKAKHDGGPKDGVEVRKTAIGRGVFARRGFKKEAIIGEITGDVMPVEFESSYCMDLDDKGVLEPSRPFRFLNHSCMPNCELVHWKHRKVDGRKVPRLWLSAIRRIKKGEELTIDYAWPAEAAIPCRPRHADIARNDLSKSLYSGPRRAEEAADGASADGAADASSQGRQHKERTGTDRRYGLHPRTSGRG